MLLIFAVYLIFCLYKVKIVSPNSNTYFEGYASKDKSTSVKGIFIILVFFSRFNFYANFTNTWDLAIC